MGRTRRQRKRRLRHSSAPTISVSNFLPALLAHLGGLSWRNITNLTVRDFPFTGRGLCSKTQHLHEGDDLIRLPLKCLLTLATLEADMDFKAQFDPSKYNKDQCVPFQSLMALYLLHHKHLGDASPWHAYLQSLPTQFSTPYFCPIAELQFLPETILEKTVAQNRQVRESMTIMKSVFAAEHCSCCGLNYFADIYTLTDFKWAYFAVNTRSVYVDSRLFKPAESHFQQLLSDAANLALAPFLDLFNHSADVSTSADLLRNESKELEFVLTLERTPAIVPPYSQIYISYGTLSNDKLLLEYGFIIPHNIHDYFEFSLLDIENFIKMEKTFSGLNYHRNKFKFIREHNLHDQMFVHLSDGVSHNLHVVLHLILKLQNHFPNVLNQVAFGAAANLENVEHEVRLLVEFKIAEYQRFVTDLMKLPSLSESGIVAKSYLEECIRYLKEYLDSN